MEVRRPCQADGWQYTLLSPACPCVYTPTLCRHFLNTVCRAKLEGRKSMMGLSSMHFSVFFFLSCSYLAHPYKANRLNMWTFSLFNALSGNKVINNHLKEICWLFLELIKLAVGVKPVGVTLLCCSSRSADSQATFRPLFFVPALAVFFFSSCQNTEFLSPFHSLSPYPSPIVATGIIDG